MSGDCKDIHSKRIEGNGLHSRTGRKGRCELTGEAAAYVAGRDVKKLDFYIPSCVSDSFDVSQYEGYVLIVFRRRILCQYMAF